MKYCLAIILMLLVASCTNPSSDNDEYLKEEEHLEQKDHTELADPDSIPDKNQ